MKYSLRHQGQRDGSLDVFIYVSDIVCKMGDDSK